MNDARFYTIGEVSSLCGVPVKTLRYYDEIGLIKPTRRTETGNYRYYCENQILALFVIRKLKLLEFPLKVIKELIEDSDVAKLQASIDGKLSQIEGEMLALNEKFTQGRHLLERLKRGHVYLDAICQQDAQESCLLEFIPEADVVYTRKIQSSYNNADVSIDRWIEIINLAEKNALSAVGAIILTYHNEPLGQFYLTDCDLEVCLQVHNPAASPLCKKYGGFQAVTAIHVGSHSTIHDAHIKAIQWIKKNGLRIDGPVSEEYIISPMDVLREDTYLSKIIIPVAGK